MYLFGENFKFLRLFFFELLQQQKIDLAEDRSIEKSHMFFLFFCRVFQFYL